MRQSTTAGMLVLLVVLSVACGGRTSPNPMPVDNTDAVAEALWNETADVDTSAFDPSAFGGEPVMPSDSSHPTAGDCWPTLKKFVRCCARMAKCQERAKKRGMNPSRCDSRFFQCASKAHTDHPDCNCGADTLEEFQWGCAEFSGERRQSYQEPRGR
ncbi:MAG: hypothetical protein HYY84_18985 [Deltaproteobacteria bacterium]|nr:hypothetical protein [Deltaproteobacteria bacterium]